ncbi:MAG: hypothetical protein WBQ94_06715 [Terracidiphilus sp.]
METNLRPLTLGEILDRTAELYRNNFVLFAGIFTPYAGTALVLNLLLIGLGVLLKNAHATSLAMWVPLVAGLVEMLILGILFGPVVASVSRAVAWVNMGQPATIRGAYQSTFTQLGRYLWLMAITFLVVWTPIALLYGGFLGVMAYNIKGFATPGAVAAQQASMADPKAMMVVGIAGLIFLVLIFPVGAYTIVMGLRYALALPVCVVENTPARASIRRAIDLSKGARGRIFVLGLLVAVIKIGLVGMTQIFTIVGVVKHHGEISATMSAISQVIGFFTNTFLGPIYATGVTLLYYDQRVRKEGFDIEWMMQAAGMAPPNPVLAAESTELQATVDPPEPEKPNE